MELEERIKYCTSGEKPTIFPITYPIPFFPLLLGLTEGIPNR